MRIQLFKGTYGVLLCFAMAGLFLMLLRQTGSGYAFLAWLGLIVVATGGLVATGSDLVGVGGVLIGLCGSLYLKWYGAGAAVGALNTEAAAVTPLRIDLSLGAYVLMAIALVTIWLTRRRPS